MINVTKAFLPTKEEYDKYLEEIWASRYVTNQGALVKKLENSLCDFLKLKNLHYVTNGTVALELALETFDIKDGEIITTPFSYVATSSSIIWKNLKPVYVDIEPNNFTIDVTKIEAKITKDTKAIMPVHVFGYACNIEEIEKIANKYSLKVIYDAAHAFGSKYKNKSLLDYGDISTCSFHATKLFNTIEGGACIVKDNKVSEKLELVKRFGHNGDTHYCLGINAKQSEFHAAMGLCNLPYVSKIIEKRKKISDLYDSLLCKKFERPKVQKDLEYNYAYYPVLFESEEYLKKVFKALNSKDIFPRRYFYPSLNTLDYIKGDSCPVSEDISLRIACLPLYFDLEFETVEEISKIMLNI